MAIFDEFPYTNFHDKNLDGMCKAIGENRNQIELNKNKLGVMRIDVDRIDALTQEMHGQVSRHEIGLNAHAQRLTTLELDDQTHTRQITELNDDVADLDGDVANHETRITALEQGGGGGGFAWTTGSLTQSSPQTNTVSFKYNIDTGMFMIPSTRLLTLDYSGHVKTDNVASIDIPAGYEVRYVLNMVEYGDTSANTYPCLWTIRKSSDGTISTYCYPVTYTATPSIHLVKGQLMNLPVYGVIEAIN